MSADTDKSLIYCVYPYSFTQTDIRFTDEGGGGGGESWTSANTPFKTYAHKRAHTHTGYISVWETHSKMQSRVYKQTQRLDAKSWRGRDEDGVGGERGEKAVEGDMAEVCHWSVAGRGTVNHWTNTATCLQPDSH